MAIEDTATDQMDLENQEVIGDEDTQPVDTEEQETQQETPEEDGNPEWWKDDLIQLKYRGQTVTPKDYKHLKQLAQQGWSYSQRMHELNQRDEELKALKERYGQYEQLDQAFKTNPAFAQAIFDLKKKADAGQLTQAEQQQVQDPIVQQLMSKLQTMEERFGSIEEQRADAAVQQEIESIKGMFPNTNFDQVTETGHPLMYDVIKHARDNRFPSLEAAAKDYLWDSHTANVQADARKAAAEARKAKARQGVVGAGVDTANTPASQGKRGMSYDEIAESIKQERNLT